MEIVQKLFERVPGDPDRGLSTQIAGALLQIKGWERARAKCRVKGFGTVWL